MAISQQEVLRSWRERSLRTSCEPPPLSAAFVLLALVPELRADYHPDLLTDHTSLQHHLPYLSRVFGQCIWWNDPLLIEKRTSQFGSVILVTSVFMCRLLVLQDVCITSQGCETVAARLRENTVL